MSFSPSQHHQQLNHRCHVNMHASAMKFSREPQSQSQSQSQHPMLQQLSSYAAVLERSASAHVYAQQLNNAASMCLEVGQYDKAISSLGKALRLSELHIVDQLLDRAQACGCVDCSLDGCITYSESESNNTNVLNFCNQNKNNLKNNMMVVEAYDPEEEGGGSEQTTTSSTSHMTSIYRRPIRIPPRSIAEGHNMGSTLFLIVTFNLALAHHLKAVSLLSSASAAAISSSSVASSTLHANTLQLYELTNTWQHRLSCGEEQEEEDDHEDNYDYDSDSDSDDDSIMTMDTTDEEEQEEEETPSRTTTRTAATASPMNSMNQMKTNTSYCSSVRFNMILCTNLSHLHRLMKNDTLSTQCLEQLLSTVMLVIDQNKNHHKEEQQPPQPHQHPHVTIDGDDDDEFEFEYCDDEDEDDLDELLVPSSSSRSRFIDVQGFIPNTTSLILQEQCADAA